MKKKSVLLVCFILSAIFASSMIGYIFGAALGREEATPQNIAYEKQKTPEVKKETPLPKSDVSAVSDAPEVKKDEKAEKSTYIVREENGKIALFEKKSDGTQTLHSSYDVPIMFLPKSDREMLKKGMEFNSIEEIKQFAEDYIG